MKMRARSALHIGLLAIAVMISNPYPALALDDGALDLGFGDAGARLIERPQSSHLSIEMLGDIAELADGRFLWAMVDGGTGIWLGRKHRDGTRDTSFAETGLIELDHCVPTPPRPLALAVDDDDGIVLWTGRCLLRFDASGQPDPAFAIDATVPASSFLAAGLVRDALGRWLLAGTDSHRFQVRRYLASGNDDLDFADAGSLRPDLPNGTQDHLYALTVQGDGRVLLAGSSQQDSHTHLVVSRWLDDGSADSSFGGEGTGTFMLAPPGGYSTITAEAIDIDRDGTLVIAGRGANSMQSCCVLATRLTAQGEVAPDFGLRLLQASGATVLSPFGETRTSVSLVPGRQILIARNSFPFPTDLENTRTRFTLIRLNADGSLDDDFGQAGWRTYIVTDPTGLGMGGPYSQLHRMRYGAGSALLFGRTFFEDVNSNGRDFVTLVRARFERLFDADFEP